MAKAHDMIEPWSPYDSRQSLTSANRVSLVKAFADVIKLRLDIEPHEFSTIFAAPSDEAENDALKMLVELQTRYFVDNFLSKVMTSFARPIGGGEPISMAGNMWELDDYLPRFATGALNLKRWANADAEPTHHIFVDKQQFELLLLSLPADDELSDYQLQCLDDPSHAIRQRQQTERPSSVNSPAVNAVVRPTIASGSQDRLLDMKTITGLCGIKKSKIYDMIKKGQFPKQVSFGGRSRWSEQEINEWIEQSKDARS